VELLRCSSSEQPPRASGEPQPEPGQHDRRASTAVLQQVLIFRSRAQSQDRREEILILVTLCARYAEEEEVVAVECKEQDFAEMSEVRSKKTGAEGGGF
jgi:hypothetical protein